MSHEPADEIRAFDLAGRAARERGRPWRPPYWISLEDGRWEVGAGNEPEEIIVVDPATGRVSVPDVPSDPVRAFAAARDYAAAHGLRWQPLFGLLLERDHWRVESCGGRLGGNVYIHVGHDGTVTEHWVNPK